MRLLINTALRDNQLLLIKHHTLYDEISWRASFNESEKVISNLPQLLQKNKLSWSDLTDLVLVTGPGSFTALRIGTNLTNILAYRLHLPIYTLNTFQYLACLTGYFDQEIWLEAGLETAYHHHPLTQVTTIESLPDFSLTTNHLLYLPKENRLTSWQLAPAIPLLDQYLKLATSFPVEPYYFRPANITQPKKNWG